ncbi:MAG: NfeD family protein [Pirellulaceae bacterium]
MVGMKMAHKRRVIRFTGLTAMALLACGIGGLAQDNAKKVAPQPAAGVKAPPAPRAFLIQVPLPIDGNVDGQVKSRIQQILKSLKKMGLPKEGPRPALVLEFTAADGSAGEQSNFGRSLELAQFLTSEQVSPVRTVAFLPRSVKGHAVLPVLACEQIIVAKEMELGPAGVQADTVDEAVMANYASIAKRRRTVPEAVVRGLIDDRAAVYQITTPDGVRFETAEGRDTLQQEGKIIKEETLFQPGEQHLLSGLELRDKFSFASHRANNRTELAAVLDVPAASLSERLAPETGWKPILVKLEGPVTQRGVNWIIKSIEGHVERDDFNLLVVQITSSGGNPAQSLRLAQKVAEIDPKYHTLAVVQNRALGDSAIIAWAADELLVADDADLGGAGESTIDDRVIQSLRDPLRQMAVRLGRNWSLPLALTDPRVQIAPYVRAASDETRYLSTEEHRELKDADDWVRQGDAIDMSRGLKGARAVEIGLAQGSISSLEELKSRYSLDDLRPIRPNWALEVVEWLADPRLAGLLLFIGWFALMIELSSPGVGVPGFISAVCFVLYFWSQFLHGTAGWLEILLFATGVAFLCVELFVVPGTGIFGIGGGVMIVISILLASQTFIFPNNAYQMRQLPVSLLMVAAGAAGGVISIGVIRRFLPHTPYFNRMLLPPPEGEQLEEIQRKEALVAWGHLSGKRGITTTQLTPSGKARFGDEVVDVISDGDLIPKGAAVYVAEVLGSRVLVRTAE